MTGVQTCALPIFGDVEAYEDPNLDLFHNDKTTILVICSKSDYERLNKKKDNDMIIIKGNPLCEISHKE